MRVYESSDLQKLTTVYILSLLYYFMAYTIHIILLIVYCIYVFSSLLYYCYTTAKVCTIVFFQLMF